MNSEPNKEQIQWLWKQCGLKYIDPYWEDSTGNLAFYGETQTELLNSIDLNNLFKYAVPKLSQSDIEFDMTFVEDTGGRMCQVTVKPFYEQNSTFGKEVMYYFRDYDPAIALFWAIYKALGGKE